MKSSKLWTIIMVILVIGLAIVPLALHPDSEFGGADGAASEAIAEIQPGYQPWIHPIWEPPGGETESLLFALQAALGAGVIGYIFGSLRNSKSTQK